MSAPAAPSIAVTISREMNDSPIIAIIDVGSNSVRLLVARQLTDSAFEVIDEERYDARLGAGQAGKDLPEESLERGLRALKVMAGVARSHNPSQIVAVGTEALRRAQNSAAFVAEARRRTGLTVRILTGEEEARAGFLGVVNSTSLVDGHLLDIGGGSLELMRVEGRSLSTITSAPLGAIYATERYFRTDPPSTRDVRALRKAVRQHFTVEGPLPELFGAGGSVRNLARMVRARRQYPLRRLHGFVIRRSEVRRFARLLVAAPPEERRKFPGMSANRIDILPAAAVVIDEVMELTGATTLTVSGQGLREGILWQQLRRSQSIVPDVRAASIAGLAAANGGDAVDGAKTAATAAVLFEASRSIHGLLDGDLDLLHSAAVLANVGMHIEFYNRERHAEYLVHSGDLHGFSHREVVLLGALVRWAGSGTPDLAPYARVVEPEDTRTATVLTTLLGVARAIHRRHPTPVNNVSAAVDGGQFQVVLKGEDELGPELHALSGQVRRFEAVFKLPMRVSVE